MFKEWRSWKSLPNSPQPRAPTLLFPSPAPLHKMRGLKSSRWPHLPMDAYQISCRQLPLGPPAGLGMFHANGTTQARGLGKQAGAFWVGKSGIPGLREGRETWFSFTG